MKNHGITQCPNCSTITSVDAKTCTKCDAIINPKTENYMSNLAFIELNENRIAS